MRSASEVGCLRIHFAISGADLRCPSVACASLVADIEMPRRRANVPGPDTRSEA